MIAAPAHPNSGIDDLSNAGIDGVVVNCDMYEQPSDMSDLLAGGETRCVASDRR